MRRPSEAEPLFRQALEARQGILPAGHLAIAQSTCQLASALQEQGKLAEAEPLHREAIRMLRDLGPNGQADLASVLCNLAALYESMGNLVAAEPFCREGLDLRRAKLGPQAPLTVRTAMSLASLLDRLDRGAEGNSLRLEYGLPSPATQATTQP
jgi:tetratricopeptide (TPR) repeat protein